jgi:hypothetical protein
LQQILDTASIEAVFSNIAETQLFVTCSYIAGSTTVEAYLRILGGYDSSIIMIPVDEHDEHILHDLIKGITPTSELKFTAELKSGIYSFITQKMEIKLIDTKTDIKKIIYETAAAFEAEAAFARPFSVIEKKVLEKEYHIALRVGTPGFVNKIDNRRTEERFLFSYGSSVSAGIRRLEHNLLALDDLPSDFKEGKDLVYDIIDACKNEKYTRAIILTFFSAANELQVHGHGTFGSHKVVLQSVINVHDYLSNELIAVMDKKGYLEGEEKHKPIAATSLHAGTAQKKYTVDVNGHTIAYIVVHGTFTDLADRFFKVLSKLFAAYLETTAYFDIDKSEQIRIVDITTAGIRLSSAYPVHAQLSQDYIVHLMFSLKGEKSLINLNARILGVRELQDLSGKEKTVELRCEFTRDKTTDARSIYKIKQFLKEKRGD